MRTRATGGGILIIVVMVMGLLFTLLAVVGSNTVINLRSTSEITERKQARYAAYAGIQMALHELAKDEEWSEEITDQSLPLDPEAEYSVHVENQMKADPDADPLIYKGIEIPAGTVYIESTGWARGAEMDRVVAGMSGLAMKADPVFNNAVYADADVRLDDGSKTDSWDSLMGTYSTVIAEDTSDAKPEDLTAYGLRQGTVGCNNVIKLRDESTVKGDVKVKPPPGGEDPDYLQVDGNSKYTGIRHDLQKPAGVPSFQAPFDPALAVDSITYADLQEPAPVGQGQGQGQRGYKWLPSDHAYNDLTVAAGQTVALEPGTYYFSDFVDIQGTVVRKANTTGPVIIYVGQDVVLNGSLNPGGSAKDFQIYFTDEKVVDEDKPPISELHLTSGTGYFVAAGKALNANLTDGDIYGAVMANSVELDSSEVHFDTTLRDLALAGISNWMLEGLHESYRR